VYSGEPRPEFFLGVEKSACGQSWRSRLDAAGQANAVAISQRLGIHEIVARVMAGRGVGLDDAETFLNPALKTDMPDPSTLTDMDKAVARLADAVAAGSSVAIFGDYDVDGATSAAILYQYLSACGLDCRIYIPDRIFEGYGPNPEAIRSLVSEGADLIVTVDCGVTSFEALEAAVELGVDVVVIDHHQAGVELPPAAAIVNPNRQDDLSGQGHLAAAGVVFLTIVALNNELKRRNLAPASGSVDLLRSLDLVALGTICDVVPLIGVNRAFVTKGLIAIRHNSRPGLQALIETTRLNGPCTAGQLGFLIGPRINAGGRIGDASLGARLLTTQDAAEARQIAERLDALNSERQAIERDAVADAVLEAEADIGAGPGPAVVICSRDSWHPGVVGLIASRLKERFDRPAFAISLSGEGGTGVGSGRSIPGVDLGAAVRAAVDEGLLVKGGGHAMAAGLTLERGRIADLRGFLEERLGEAVAARMRERSLKIDGALMAGAASVDLVDELDKAGPYGSGHPTPLFAFPAHRVDYAETVGNGHVRCSLRADVGSRLKAIAFRAGDTDLGRMLLGSKGAPLHVAGTLGVDYWGGTAKTQLRIVDAAAPKSRY
jgi:single-stranded-DNA-specific exonuclease